MFQTLKDIAYDYLIRPFRHIEIEMAECDNPDCPLWGDIILDLPNEHCPSCGKPVINLDHVL